MQLFVDFTTDLAGGVSYVPTSLAATTNTTGVNLTNGDVRTHVIIDTGSIVNAASLAFVMQESTDNTTFTNVADANATFTVNTANAQSLVSFQRAKPFVRANVTLSGGTSPTILTSVDIFCQKKVAGTGAGATSGVDRSPST
jgi:hypothetical protein